MKLIIVLTALFAFIQCKEVNPCSGLNCGVTVEVGTYFESLCPDSRAFILNQLFPTFNKLQDADPPIMTVNLVPFGNANISFVPHTKRHPTVNFTCQHKDQECEGNLIQSCAVAKYDINKSLALVNCMFNSTNWKTPWTSAAECTPKVGISFDALSECANSLDGIAIEYFMAGQTKLLEKPGQWALGVPFVTINGNHTADIQQKAETNLLRLVCDTYPGIVKPDACKSA